MLSDFKNKSITTKSCYIIKMFDSQNMNIKEIESLILCFSLCDGLPHIFEIGRDSQIQTPFVFSRMLQLMTLHTDQDSLDVLLS